MLQALANLLFALSMAFTTYATSERYTTSETYGPASTHRMSEMCTPSDTCMTSEADTTVRTRAASETDATADGHVADAGDASPPPVQQGDVAAAAATALPTFEVEIAEHAYGKSGALRVRLALPAEQITLPLEWRSVRPEIVSYGWIPVLGTPVSAGAAPQVLGSDDRAVAPNDAGVYEVELIGPQGVTRVLDGIRYIVQVPFERKEDGYIMGYLIGRYPTEGSDRTDRYAPPVGFIQVTPALQEMRLSDHFTLEEFLTHDQASTWPKFAAVDLRLLDKLELVMQELNADGMHAELMVVMSGFRTPHYNRQGLDAGRARLSRHQYGDAADVWVDNDDDWYMDDLNGDGRRDTDDARVMLRAVNSIEARHPQLIGGAGIYGDNGVHGPFIHIDVRGYRARW